MPKFRSKFEKTVADRLKLLRVPYGYETTSIPYQSVSKYTPDFILPNGIMIEAKGWLRPSDRAKMRFVKEQHPELDIRFVFQNANNTISRKSKTTYAVWATRHGFKWAHGNVPQAWIAKN